MMRTALRNSTPEKRVALVRACPNMTVDTLLKSGPVSGLRLKGASIRSLRVEQELEKSIFEKLEDTRCRLEDELGPLAFVQAYRMIQSWREAEDDEGEGEGDGSEARREEIERLLESKNAGQHFQELLKLVVSDSAHYEKDADTDADSECDGEGDTDIDLSFEEPNGADDNAEEEDGEDSGAQQDDGYINVAAEAEDGGSESVAAAIQDEAKQAVVVEEEKITTPTSADAPTESPAVAVANVDANADDGDDGEIAEDIVKPRKSPGGGKWHSVSN